MNLDTSLSGAPSEPDARRQAAQPTRTLWRRIAWFEPVWLAILMPSILMPGRFWAPSFQPYLVLALFAFWPVRRLAYGRWSEATPFAWPVGILMLWTPLTLWVAADLDTAWIAVGYLLLGVALYWGLINWPPARHHPLWIALPLAFSGLGLALLGPQLLDMRQGSQLFRLPALYVRFGQLIPFVGESMNGNVLAGGMAMIVPYFAALAVEPRWSRRPWLPIAAAALALAGLALLILTQSRGALLATLSALVVLGILRWRRLIWLTPLLAAGIGYGVWRIGVANLLDVLSSDTSLVGLSGRLEIWDRATLAMQDFLWTGVGQGQFSLVVPQLYPFFTLPTNIPHAHNLFLQVGMDMGLVGILAYGAVIAIALTLAGQAMARSVRARNALPSRGKRWRRHTQTWALGAGVMAALINVLLHGVVDAVLWNTKLAFLPWLLFAQVSLLGKERRLARRRRRRRSAIADESSY